MLRTTLRKSALALAALAATAVMIPAAAPAATAGQSATPGAAPAERTRNPYCWPVIIPRMCHE
ncbi:MAG: hypothetical protein QOG42_1488 [Solirubrobacteraceae bacterium]|jgi:invasion protein IalB|nr:hypothetical protein [Solirubrobacteraceae bacterium]